LQKIINWPLPPRLFDSPFDASGNFVDPRNVVPVDDEVRVFSLDWFHEMVEEDGFELLINTYRLRLDDEHKYENKSRGIYAGGPNNKPLDDYREFTKLARKQNVLPRWWSPGWQERCERKAEGVGRCQLMLKLEEDMLDKYCKDDGQTTWYLRQLGVLIFGTEINTSGGIIADDPSPDRNYFDRL